MDTKRVVTAFAIGLPALFAILAGGLWLAALVMVIVFIGVLIKKRKQKSYLE